MRLSHTAEPIEALEPRRLLSADLSVQIASPGAGGSLAFGIEQRALITVRNAGTTSVSDDFTVQLFASTDNTLDSGDTVLGSRRVSSLSGGESETEDIEFRLPSTLAAGAYHLFALIDPDNIIPESNESNNTSDPIAVTVGSTGGNGGGGGGGGDSADLAAAIVSPAAGTMLARGVEHRVLITVTNRGGAGAGVPAGLRLFASADGVLDAGDTLLGARSVSILSAGEAETEDIEFTVPASLTGGSYNLFAVVDQENAIAESDETNNTSLPVAVTIGASGNGGGGGGGGGGGNNNTAPDLSATLISPSTPLVPNQEARVLVTIRNDGGSRVRGVGLSVYATRGQTPDPATDTLLGSRTISTLSAGETETEDVEFRVPASLAGQTLRLYAFIDPSGVFAESNEANNVSTPVEIAFAPTVLDLGGSITTSRLSDDLIAGTSSRSSVRYTIANEGNQNLPRGAAAMIGAYLRPADAQDDSRDISLGGTKRESLSGLQSGRSRSRDFSLSIPSTIAPGEYRLVMKFDDSFNDPDRSNNTAVEDRVIRIAPAVVDPSLAAAAGAATARAGGRAFKASATITNLGNSTAGGRATIMYFLRDAEGNETSLRRAASKSLSLKAGRSATVTANLSIPSGFAPGAYTLVARMTTTGADADTGNNSFIIGAFSVT